MPWRDETDPYRIWLSEVMLQQTQIKTVIPYYHSWLRSLPDIQSAAKAEEDHILKLWEGLGYYGRARNFHSACRSLAERNLFTVPDTPEEFVKLKGVGEYICAAVQSIAFFHAIPAVDSNVKRLMARIRKISWKTASENKDVHAFLRNNISKLRPGDFNQAMMDLARYICKPAKPLCRECPVNQYCAAFKDNCVPLYPARKQKKTKPHYRVAVGIIWQDNRILISKRKRDGLLGGLWEFPGGKLQENETGEICVKREIKEELNVDVIPGNMIAEVRHSYTHFSITLSGYHCKYSWGKPTAAGCDDWKWVYPDELEQYPFPKANHKLLSGQKLENPFDH